MRARAMVMGLLARATQLADRAMPPRLRMLKMLTGAWVAQAICVAAQLRIADALGDGAMTAGELAAKTGADASALYRLLRALASVGLFVEDKTGRFSATPTGATLRSGDANSVLPLAQMMGAELYRSWGELLYSVRTAKPAFERVFHMPLFEYLEKNPDSGLAFDACMASIHGAESESVLSSYDFAGGKTVVDVGGGKGSLVLPLLQKYPQLEGVLFDLPPVIERARETFHAAGLNGRCRLTAGSFFDSVPPNADFYLLRHVIHDWDDDAARKILENCRKAMPASSRLLIVESVIPPGNGFFSAKLLDLNMLVVAGGLERTREQFERLVRSAGFEQFRVLPTKLLRLSIIEARPAAR